MAAATLILVCQVILVCQGSSVVAGGKRRVVDPHWFRGHSYARIGADWIRRALAVGGKLILRLALTTAVDPQPARASRQQPEGCAWIQALPWKIRLLQEAPLNAIAGA
jgi:hypothetical protein